jgi:hypothetical protein
MLKPAWNRKIHTLSAFQVIYIVLLVILSFQLSLCQLIKFKRKAYLVVIYVPEGRSETLIPLPRLEP